MPKRTSAKCCVHCGDRTTNPKYCSNACQKSAEWSARRALIATGGSIPNGSIRAARRFVLETQGHCCAICASSVWCGSPVPLVLDHIDGNANNWAVANLRYICPNCDAQLPTFKSRNRGKGRVVRRMRYRDGKSY
jgi:hypothetical protein